MADIKAEMERLYPPLPDCPPNHKFSSIAGLYADYIGQLACKTVTDPMGKKVYFLPENFPHLVKLEFYNSKTRTWTDASARPTVKHLEAGTLDESRHRISDPSRPRTLFWVTDVLESPDGIYDNKKNGMDVYVKRYKRQSGSKIKIALVTDRPGNGRVLITSFWTDDKYLKSCVKGDPKHSAHK